MLLQAEQKAKGEAAQWRNFFLANRLEVAEVIQVYGRTLL